MLHQQNLADQMRVLGGEHPQTLTTRGNLAAAYQAAGRTDEAVMLLERALTDQVGVQGAEHPQTLTTRGNLAAAYRAMNEASKAPNLHEQPDRAAGIELQPSGR
jgi:hypothetical protein